jgi:hypothetical protein
MIHAYAMHNSNGGTRHDSFTSIARLGLCILVARPARTSRRHCLTVITNAAYGTVIYDDVQVEYFRRVVGDCVISGLVIAERIAPAALGHLHLPHVIPIRTCPAVCALSYGLYWISLLALQRILWI